MEKEIVKAIQYFGFFKYTPLEDEIYSFFKKKVTFDTFQIELRSLVKQKKVKSLPISPARYTLGEYSIRSKDMHSKVNYSKRKIRKIGRYIKLLWVFPQVKLIGLSGSVAMLNAEKDADIDFFIISAKRRLWTARFIAIGLAKVMGIHRQYDEKHVGDKVCLNLFFDESNLTVPKRKQNEYVAHEVLQMKPQKVKKDSYLRYLDANKWVFDIFPNAQKQAAGRSKNETIRNFSFSFFGGFVETLFKRLQIFLIKKHKTTEIITATQLWFFPDDFEKKMKLSHKVALNKKGK